MRVRKVKKEKRAPRKNFFDSKEKIIGFSIAAAVLVILIAVVMLLDLKDEGRLIIKNDTDLKLEYVSAKYVSAETDLTQPVKTDSIDANKTFSMKVDPLEFIGYNANYNISLKFKDHDELSVDAGLFNTRFTGDIKIVFSKTKDPNKLKMTVKAKKGLIPSGKISCDDEYTVDFKEGAVYN